MTDDHTRDEALLALVQGLVAMRQFPSTMLAATEPVEPPAGLETWLTPDEAERAALLEDARWWFAQPKPFGLGLEVELLPWRRVVEDGLEVISPLEFRLSWVETMNPFDQPVQSTKGSLARVIFAEGSWRVAAFWTAAERERHHEQLARLKALLEGAAPNGASPELDGRIATAITRGRR